MSKGDTTIKISILGAWLRRHYPRMLLLALVDIIIITISYLSAFWLRFDVMERSTPAAFGQSYLLQTLICLILIRLFCGWAGKQYFWSFSHASLTEGVHLVVTVFVGTAFFAMLCHGFSLFAPPPRSIYLMEAAMTIAGMTLLRFLPKYLLTQFPHGVLRRFHPNADSVRRTLIYDGGDNSEILAKELRRTSGYELIGFIDNNPGHWKSRIHGLRVLGDGADLPALLEKYHVDLVLVGSEDLSGRELRELVELCTAREVALKRIPPYRELIHSNGFAHMFDDIRPEQLLDRQPVAFDQGKLFDFIANKTIMVTGAAGSIGSELCRQIAENGARRLVIFDMNENSLFFLQADLRELYPDVDVVLAIGSVRDRRRVDELLARVRPNMIFHAAAHKHVPLLEFSPGEAIKNNVLGTYEVAASALAHGVERFALISSDKAVASGNIMGASKRLAERVIHDMNGKGVTKFFAVRFGNVLGSNGSLLEIIRRQIAKGGPVTVTHRDMTRYFMTIPEAVGLVLAAATLNESETYVLDMGEPVKIDTLVRQLIHIWGFTPDRDMEIRYIGPRPGEKLTEILYGDGEAIVPSSHKRINVVRAVDEQGVGADSGSESYNVSAMLLAARLAVESGDEQVAKAFFLEWVADYKPGDQPIQESPAPESQAQVQRSGEAVVFSRRAL